MVEGLGARWKKALAAAVGNWLLDYMALVAALIERLVVRHLYGRMIDTMLATWGLSLLMVGLVTLIFGNTAVSVPARQMVGSGSAA